MSSILKHIILLISFLTIASGAMGQWERISTMISGNDTLNIKDFHFFDKDEGLVFCNKSTVNPNHLWGYILKTVDGGISWDTLRIMQDTVPVSVEFTSDTVGQLLCKIPQHTEIRTFKTSDAGLNWTAKNLIISANPPYQDIHFYNDTIGIYSTNGYSAITHDGGDSWDSLNNVGSENMFIKENFVLLADGNGYGVSYDTLNTYSIGSVFESGSINYSEVSINNGDTTLIVSALGGPGSEFGYPFTNYGMIGIGDFHTSQYSIFHFPEHRTRSLEFKEGLIYIGCSDLFGNERHILKSEDGGNTWWTQEIINLNEAAWLGIKKIQCLDNDTCIAADGYSLYKTTNGGGPLLEQVGHQVFLSTDENEMPSKNLSIYPNPTSYQLHIASDEQIKNIRIVDLNGRLVYSENTNSLKTTIQVESLSSGIYVVHVETSTETTRKKIVKR